MDRNVADLLYRIKQNIKEAEKGNVTDELLQETREDCLQMLELMKLFLISERDSYYGYFLMNLGFVTDFASHSIAGIRLNAFPPVFCCNPFLLCRFSLKEILYIVCHEIDHILLNHPAEMVKANPQHLPDLYQTFNLAADASVNDRIDHEITAQKRKFLARPDGVITSKSLAKMFGIKRLDAMESYLYYYTAIYQKNVSNMQQLQQPQQMLQKQAENQPPKATEGQDDHTAADQQADETPIVTAQNVGQPTDHDWQAGDDAEDATAVARELVNAAQKMMSSETRGLMPGYFLSAVEKINRPPVLCWQKILKKYVGTISAEKIKTHTRLNRRQPERFDLSGARDDKVLKIAVAIDTSGSVGDEDISKILNEILAILAKRKHQITVIECDSEVQRVYEVRKPEDVKRKVAGRGGTSFIPVIQYINDHRNFRDALLIYFTDGYGDDSIPKPRTYRNLWVILGNKDALSLKEPYGTVIDF